MSQVLVWECDHSGKLFRTKTAYIKHLKKLAHQRREEKRQQKFNAQRNAFFDRMGQEITSINELINFIKTNWSWFYQNGRQHSYYKRGSEHELVDIKINVKWNDCVSNSHSCPRNGVCNWGGNETFSDGLLKPNGYPGWFGFLEFIVRPELKKYDGYGANYFNNTIINTGSGGGGSLVNGVRKYHYDIWLFADDFPAMALRREKTISWQAISDKKITDVVI